MKYRAPEPMQVPHSPGTHRLVAEILAQRAWLEAPVDPAAVRDIPDLGLAVELIHRAVREERWITVYGDYDADGVTGTAVLIRTLRRLAKWVSCVIPDRFRDGYGFHAHLIGGLDHHQHLIITCDVGITAKADVAKVRKTGALVIVTDHHRMSPSGLPAANAIVTPQVLVKDHPTRPLSGAGVAWAVARELGCGDDDAVLGLAAIGTVADVVPLTGLNRTIVRRGIEALRRIAARGEPAGIARLLQAARVRTPLDETDIAWRVAPLINAAGRMASARLAVDLLLAEDDLVAEALAEDLVTLNEMRRQELDRVLETIPSFQLPPGRVEIIAHDPRWHPGVISLAASRLLDQYRLPVFLMAPVDGHIAQGPYARAVSWVGSARAPEGFPLLDVLRRCEDYLERWGGHEQAAGFTVRPGAIDWFRTRLVEAIDAEALVRAKWSPHRGRGQDKPVTVDAVMTLSDLTPELAAGLEALRPFGAGNPEPRFLLQGAEVVSSGRIGDTIRRLTLSDATGTAQAIWIDAPPRRFAAWEKVNAVVRIDLRSREPSLIIDDLWPTWEDGI